MFATVNQCSIKFSKIKIANNNCGIWLINSRTNEIPGASYKNEKKKKMLINIDFLGCQHATNVDVRVELVQLNEIDFIQIYMTTTSVNQFTSSLLLTVMSADRFIAVCHPISSTSYRTPAIAKVTRNINIELIHSLIFNNSLMTHGVLSLHFLLSANSIIVYLLAIKFTFIKSI